MNGLFAEQFISGNAVFAGLDDILSRPLGSSRPFERKPYWEDRETGDRSWRQKEERQLQELRRLVGKEEDDDTVVVEMPSIAAQFASTNRRRREEVRAIIAAIIQHE